MYFQKCESTREIRGNGVFGEKTVLFSLLGRMYVCVRACAGSSFCHHVASQYLILLLDLISSLCYDKLLADFVSWFGQTN